MCNLELRNFFNWCSANKLTINLDKTCFMVISNRFIPPLQNCLKIDSTYLKHVSDYKFLGVQIDDKLKFNKHISDISFKISKSVGILYKLSNYLPIPTMLNIYYALVNSYFMYCNAIW